MEWYEVRCGMCRWNEVSGYTACGVGGVGGVDGVGGVGSEGASELWR